MRHAVLLWAALAFALTGPRTAAAHDFPDTWFCYDCDFHTIAGLTNLIARLEADPDVDDGYKGPIVSRARAKILKLRAELGLRHPVWPTPCCYSRKPIYIR